MNYQGDIRLGDTIDIKFSTVDDTGAPTTLAGSPVVSAYPGNSTTEITAGITLTVDFDGRTGLHNVRVVASSGNGYAAAGNYNLVITTGTVDGVSVVGYVVGSFSIEARSALRPTTAGRTLEIESDGVAHADLKEWLGVAPNALSSGRVEVLVGAITAGVIAAASFAANALDAVWSTATRLLTAGTNIALAKGTGVTGFNDLSAAQVNAEVDTALTDIHLDHLFQTTYDPASKPGAADALLNELVESDGGVARYTANALEQAPSGTGASAAAIADEVLNRALSGHTTAGTVGQRLQPIRTGTAQAGAASTITLDAGASASDDFYNDAVVHITGGTGVGQSKIISDYVGSTKVATITPNWVTNPDGTSVFQVLPGGSGTVTGTVDANVVSVAADAITSTGIQDGAFTAAKFAADFLTAAKVAADVGTEIATAVWAAATRLLTAGTNIVLAKGTGVTGLNDLSAAQVNAEVDTALADIHLDHLLAVDYDPAAKPGTGTALLNELVESDAGVSRFTVNALEQGPSGSGASAASIADAVWEELIADHEGTVGSTAEALATAGGSGASAADIADAVLDEALAGHVAAGSLGERIGRIPNNAPSAAGGLPTVDSENRIAGIQGTLPTLDALDTAQDAQHATTQAAVAVVDGIVDAIVIDTAALNDSALPDSIPADGSLPTLKQAVYMLAQFMNERSVAGTTCTIRKVDGSTTLYTLQLDDPIEPTTVSRAT